MLQGKKVVHATLEIKSRKAARRYDVRISGRNFKDIREDSSLVEKKLVPLKRIGAGLHIKDYTASLCSVQDLRVYLERLRSKGFNFDLVIVDHADLMYSPRQYKERRFELSSIIAGLRRLASEFSVPIWTASQATRKAGEAGKTRLWDIAEDIGKANWADFAITLSQSDQEKEESIAYLKLAKTREDGGNPKVQVVIDYETMKMTSAKREAIDVRTRT
jgi:replicative DNA helicase